MASIITMTQEDQALVVAASGQHDCAYCGSPIISGERWVREKIYEPFTANGPRYHRYHADLFAGQELSCWEKAPDGAGNYPSC
jgi:hypothetical protein